jgi:hypothetical protein
MAYTNPTAIASGATWAQLQSNGLSGILELLIAQLVATLAPTVAATANPTGGGASGGLLAAGTYYFVITESNGIGETTIGPESALLTVGATNIPQITFQALKTNNVSRNVYLSALNSAAGGPYFLYATGIVAATYNLAVAVPANSYAVNPPTSNSTAPSSLKLQLIRAAKTGNLQDVYRLANSVVKNFGEGDPLGFPLAIAKLRDAHLVFALLAEACAEAGTLIDANPGTLATVATPIGNRKPVRTFP